MLLILNINLEISLQYRKVAVLAFIHALCLDLLRANHSVSERHIYFHRAFVINHNATPRTTWFLWHMLFEKLRLTDNLNTECSFLLSIYGVHAIVFCVLWPILSVIFLQLCYRNNDKLHLECCSPLDCPNTSILPFFQD